MQIAAAIGTIDDVRMYNRALSAQEVGQLTTKKEKAAALGRATAQGALLGEGGKGKAQNSNRCSDYAVLPDLTDSAALSDRNTSLNIKAVSDVTASSMSDGAR
jgi:hypothetical protein